MSVFSVNIEECQTNDGYLSISDITTVHRAQCHAPGGISLCPITFASHRNAFLFSCQTRFSLPHFYSPPRSGLLFQQRFPGRGATSDAIPDATQRNERSEAIRTLQTRTPPLVLLLPQQGEYRPILT